MSIYVAIEVLKWFQVRLVHSDPDLLKDPSTIDVSFIALEANHHDSYGKNSVQVNNTEIIENLGQVDLCICDKTGTLTENSLSLKRIYMDGMTFKMSPTVASNISIAKSAENYHKKFSIDSI